MQTHAWKGNWKDSFPYPAETKHTDELVKGNWKDIFLYSACCKHNKREGKVKGNGKDICLYSREAKMIGWFTRHHENTQNWRQKAFFFFSILFGNAAGIIVAFTAVQLSSAECNFAAFLSSAHTTIPDKMWKWFRQYKLWFKIPSLSAHTRSGIPMATTSMLGISFCLGL